MRHCQPRPRCVASRSSFRSRFITSLFHVKGYAAPETKAATERARLLIEQAEALGEPPEDPLLLFSVLYSFWTANFVAFDGDAMHELAAQFLALAEKQGATVPLMIGHRLMGMSLAWTGDIAEGRAHYDHAIALYDPAEHRPLATRFGHRRRVATLCFRSLALWVLGYPDAALADAEHALNDAREIGQAANFIVCAVVTCLPTSTVEITRQQTRKPKKLLHWRTKKAPCLEGTRNVGARLRFGPDRQSALTQSK